MRTSVPKNSTHALRITLERSKNDVFWLLAETLSLKQLHGDNLTDLMTKVTFGSFGIGLQ